jgi:hypothetical protein
MQPVIHVQMVGASVCEWTSAERNRAFFWWKSPDQWASDVHKFALRTGEAEVVETVNYFQSEAGSPVFEMPEEVILRICQTVRDLRCIVQCRCCSSSESHQFTKNFAVGQQEQSSDNGLRFRS